MVTPQDFLALADELILDTSPIKIRTAVCRGYYGAFHAASEFHNKLPSPGILLSDGGKHEELIQRLENPSIPRTDARWIRSKSIGTMLRRLRTDRTNADYFINDPFEIETAKTSLASAKAIVQKSTS